MCIVASVGQGGTNSRSDVRIVQVLLNMNLPAAAALVPDGSCGPASIAAITQFQATVVGGTDPAGLVLPGTGTTLAALRNGISSDLAADTLGGMYTEAPMATVTKFFAALAAGMANGSINTPLRQAHFLAQLGHESAELRFTEELASGAAYEGRLDLGNTQPGDGERFKGRGLIQLTGRANYTAFTAASGTDVVSNPDIVASDTQLAVDVSVWFWTKHGLNALADVDNVLSITKVINGGTNGLADRETLLARSKWFLMDPDAGGVAAAVAAVAGQ